MSRVNWTPRARQHLDGIYDYIAETDGRPAVAAKLLRDIDRKVNQYANQPLMGTVRPEFGPDYRCFSHTRYVVIYQPLKDGIEVHAVVDGAQDYGSLFEM